MSKLVKRLQYLYAWLKVRAYFKWWNYRISRIKDAIRATHLCIAYIAMLKNSNPIYSSKDFRTLCVLGAFLYCDQPIVEMDAKLYEKNKKFVDGVINDIESVEICSRYRIYSLRLRLMQARLVGAEARVLKIEELLKKRAKDEQELKDPSWVEFEPLYEKLKTECRALSREVDDRLAYKLDFSLQHLALLVGLLSPFFLISGYIYDHYFLGHFGLDTSQYFSISDYLSSSIEQIRSCFISAILAIGSMYLGAHHGSLQTSDVRQQEHRSWNRMLAFTNLVTALALIVNYFIPSPAFPFLISLAIYVLAYDFLPYIAERFFIDKRKALFLLMFFVVFSASMYSAIGASIYAVEHKTQLGVTTAYESDIDLSKFVLLSANSSYLFFYDAEQHKVLVLPRSAIRSYVVTTASHAD